jgi:reactive chlorine resistance protein C
VFIVRYFLVILLLWTGLLKFSPHEANAIRPLAEKSPLFAWILTFLSTRDFSFLLGFFEIITAVLIALRPISSLASAIGSLLAVITFLAIISFVVTSPELLDRGISIPFIRHSTTQFVITHMLLLIIAGWILYESLASYSNCLFTGKQKDISL